MWRHKPIHPRYVYVHVYYIYIPTRHLYIIQYKYIVNKICIHISNVCTHTYYQKKYGQKYPWYSFSRMQPPRSNLKITEAGTSTKDPGFMRFLADLFRVDKEWFPGRFPIPKFLKPKKTKDVVVELQKFQRLGSQKKRTGWGRWRCPHRTWLCKTLGSTQHCQVWFLAGSDPWHLCMGQTPKQATCL